MGIEDLLLHLPGGKQWLHDFYRLHWKNKTVPIDAAGLLFQCAAKHAKDYLKEEPNYIPALIEFSHHLNFLRSICLWDGMLYFDGMNNNEKRFEDDRRRQKRDKAKDDYGRIKITPEYVAMAMCVAKLMNIKCFVSKEEADPQVSYVSMSNGWIPVTGDSDILAYGFPQEQGSRKVVIVQSYEQSWYRIIDLDANTEPGEYPLLDLYNKHGRIVFQLYAGCRGCDFTEQRCGISGIGYSTFLTIASSVEGHFNAHNFSVSMWNNDATKHIAIKNGMDTVEKIESHLQRVVDIYSKATVYDNDGNIVSMDGATVNAATDTTTQHMTGMIHPKEQVQYTPKMKKQMEELQSMQFLNLTATNQSTIRGAKLPDDKTAEQCSVPQLRDFVVAHGGNATGKKADLVVRAKQLQFINAESPKPLFDRNPNPNGLMYTETNASGLRTLHEILQELLQASSREDEDKVIHSLIQETYALYAEGLFEDKYDNIALVAPELLEGLIYKLFGHVGSSVNSKNIGDAFKRCLYNNNTAAYHGIAFVPNTNRVIILSKAHASMARDEKTRNKTDKYEPPEKKQYLVILEMFYRSTNVNTGDKHSLGVFTGMGRTYCGGCVAGQGSCRHRPERLWHQFHHWTDGRKGIVRPPTLEACSWVDGGRKLTSAVASNIHELQTVKHEKTVDAQKKKMQRNRKVNSTEGHSSEHQPHKSDRKQAPSKKRFSLDRPCLRKFLDSLKD